jgi:hypothetical protein
LSAAVGKPVDPGYWRKWRAAHPEYRARERERRRGRTRRYDDRRAEYKKQAERRRRLRLREIAENGWVIDHHPLLEQAKEVASSLTTRDRGVVIYEPRWEEAVSVAALALVEGEDPELAVKKHLHRESEWRYRTCPLNVA